MDDLIERCGEQHGMCLVGDDCGNLHTMWEAETALIELRAHIAALEADNARLMGLVSSYRLQIDQLHDRAKIKEATDGRVTD